jgi:hypothetical protein
LTHILRTRERANDLERKDLKVGRGEEKCVVRLAARTIRVVGQLLLKYIAAADKKDGALMWKVGGGCGGRMHLQGKKLP